MGPDKHYLICTTPRTGSSFLCAVLRSTGAAGMQQGSAGVQHGLAGKRQGSVVGAEYLLELVGRRDQRVGVASLDRDGLRSFIRHSFERSGTRNGVAGFKVMWEQIRLLAKGLGCARSDDGFGFHDFAGLLPEQTRFVWLTRRDRTRQAVSLVKALQSQCWNSAEQERFGGRYVFDYVGLLRISRMLERHDARWREFFERNAIVPLEIAYEDVIRDREEQVSRILEFIEIPASGAGAAGEVHYRQQSDALNDLWVRRFERIRSLPPLGRAAYAALSAPRWIRLRATKSYRIRRRVRRSPSGERITR